MMKISNPNYKEHFIEMMDELPDDLRKKAQDAYNHLTIDKVTVIHDNELLPFCGGIKVIYTPGHTPGHLCLYLERYKTLIAGDELNVRDGNLVGPSPIFTHDMKLAIESLSKFKKLDIQEVYCFHGGAYNKEPKTKIVQIATN